MVWKACSDGAGAHFRPSFSSQLHVEIINPSSGGSMDHSGKACIHRGKVIYADSIRKPVAEICSLILHVIHLDVMLVKYEAFPPYGNENTAFLPSFHFLCVSKHKNSQEIFSHPSVLKGFTSSSEMAQVVSETGIVLPLMLLEPGIPQQRSDQLLNGEFQALSPYHYVSRDSKADTLNSPATWIHMHNIPV